MNVLFEKELGIPQPTLPLKNSGRIYARNSLRENWEIICPRQSANDEVYLIGNPPFGGTTNRTLEQSKDMEIVFNGFKNFKSLDYVTCWFWKGTNYIANSNAKLAFVATNSICQGEQVALLWKPIFSLNLSIQFAYQAFIWANNAKDKAAVHTIIISISSKQNIKETILFSEIDKSLIKKTVENINQYLIDGKSIFIKPRANPISPRLEMLKGSQPTDNNYLFLTEEKKEDLLKKYPYIEIYIRDILGSKEFLNSLKKYCLWFENEDLIKLREIPVINEILEKISEFRLKSKSLPTKQWADRPHLFTSIRQPKEGIYLLIPRVSSERRKYIPMGFVESKVISTDANILMPNATLYEFAILTSEMHNDWMRVVAGRLKSDYRYSNTLVYNNFPFPEVTEQQKAEISELAEEILLVREDYPNMTLAQLYNPETMPEPLKQAHKTLDQAVEKLYRSAPFTDSSERVAFLFQRYEALIKAEEEGNQ